METPSEREDIVMSALSRYQIVVSNLSVQNEGEKAVLTFNLVGLRRLRRPRRPLRDEAAELERRLHRIFPGLEGLTLGIEAVKAGRRWRRTVRFRLAGEELEENGNLRLAVGY